VQTVTEVIHAVLAPSTSPMVIQSITSGLPNGLPQARAGDLDVWSLYTLLENVSAAFCRFHGKASPVVIDTLRLQLLAGHPPRPSRVHLKITSDAEVLLATRECQRLTRPFFSLSDQVRVTTVVSELSRNIYMYAKEGTVHLTLSEEREWRRLEIVASDLGPGIPDVDLVLSGNYTSRTGLGRGLAGSKALLDELHVASAVGAGTTVRGIKKVRWT
jgi:serine/threonine-protein kinase RsbT